MKKMKAILISIFLLLTYAFIPIKSGLSADLKSGLPEHLKKIAKTINCIPQNEANFTNYKPDPSKKGFMYLNTKKDAIFVCRDKKDTARVYLIFTKKNKIIKKIPFSRYEGFHEIKTNFDSKVSLQYYWRLRTPAEEKKHGFQYEKPPNAKVWPVARIINDGIYQVLAKYKNKWYKRTICLL